MASHLNLDAYLQRIHWSGPIRLSYDGLAALLSAHMEHIPFENLDVLLGRGVRLDLEALEEKLVHNRRGGYCFEQSTLLAEVLEALGFEPVRHSARVVLVAPRTASPRTHMFLTVALPEGKFVVDPGFGGLAPRVPVPITEHLPGSPENVSHWLVCESGFWILRTRTEHKMVDCWASTLEPDNAADFELANYFTATHPRSPFVNGLMMRAYIPGGRVTVMNRDVTTWRADGPQLTKIVDRAALRKLLIEYFGFDLPEVEHLRVPAIPEWS